MEKKVKEKGIYFVLLLGLGLAFGFAFSTAFTGFIGSPQQTSSHDSSQPHGSSTKTTKPQSSH